MLGGEKVREVPLQGTSRELEGKGDCVSVTMPISVREFQATSMV